MPAEKKIYTNIPGSAFRTNFDDEKNKQQRTAENLFRQPVARPAQSIRPVGKQVQGTFRGRGISPDYGFGAKQDSGTSYDALAKEMLDPANLSQNVGGNFSRKERAARVGSRRIQNQRLLAKMAAGIKEKGMGEEGQTARMGMRNQAMLADTGLRNQGMMARERLSNKSAMDRQRASTKGRMAELDKRYGYDKELAEKKNIWDKEKSNRQFVGGLAKMGVPIDERMMNAYNQEGNFGVDLSGVQVPREAERPKQTYIQPKFDKEGNQYPGTGMWTTAPGEGMTGLVGDETDQLAEGQDVDEMSTSILMKQYSDELGPDFDPRNPTPAQRNVLIRARREAPDVFNRIRQQY